MFLPKLHLCLKPRFVLAMAIDHLAYEWVASSGHTGNVTMSDSSWLHTPVWWVTVPFQKSSGQN